MTGITPNFGDWRNLSAIEIGEIAILMHGLDPRAVAMGEVTVRDPHNPTCPHGVPLDTSWEEKMLISGVLTGDLLSAPENVIEPNRDTQVVKKSLIPWLRRIGGYDFLADGLTVPPSKHSEAKRVAKSHQPQTSQPLDSVPKESPTGTPKFSMNRAGMIQQHLHEWPTIDADMRGAADNGLSAAKAGARGWVEMKAMDWARSKGKLVVPPNSTSLTSSMNNIVGRKHTLDG
jgi:hypothetical protein